jgi:hypothetical protein
MRNEAYLLPTVFSMSIAPCSRHILTANKLQGAGTVGHPILWSADCKKNNRTMSKRKMSNKLTASRGKPAVAIQIEHSPKGKWKVVGGGDRDQWNDRLLNLVVRALPVDQHNDDAVSHAGSAVAAGTVDMNPSDPIEGMLIAQLVVANEAALSMYRRAWACPPDHYFEAHTKYLQLADKASRTVAMLTERLDQHRGRGHQQIVVKHVTVNADQAMVADNIVTGKTNDVTSAAKLLAATVDQPMPNIGPTKDTVPVDGGRKSE